VIIAPDASAGLVASPTGGTSGSSPPRRRAEALRVTITPISGRDAAAQLFDRAARTVDDLATPGGDQDLPGAMVDLTTAPLASQVAARILEAQDATTHALLDIFA
jgi:hypothetical protein